MEVSRQDDFPHCRDGDVSIVINSNQTYQLHSSVLMRNSAYFGRELQLPGARLSFKAQQQNLAAYRFELVVRGPDDIGYFERKQVTDSGHVPLSTFFSADPAPFSGRNHGPSPLTQQAWHTLLSLFYNHPLSLPDPSSDPQLATTLSLCTALLAAADSTGSTTQIRGALDLSLLRLNQPLWNAIAHAPLPWTTLGLHLHSESIFTEGTIHLVGTWNAIPSSLKSTLHPAILNLVSRKHSDLELTKEAVEMRILGHYPTFLHRRASDKPGRPSYANDIYMWMALSFFRQWFAQAISHDRTRRSSDGGWGFYNMLAKGGKGYLSHEDFRAFHGYFPMSSKACNVLEANMGVVKEGVKGLVGWLVVKGARAGGEDAGEEGGGVKWLTCTEVERQELPWLSGEDGMVGERGQVVEPVELKVQGREGEGVAAAVGVMEGKGKGKAKEKSKGKGKGKGKEPMRSNVPSRWDGPPGGVVGIIGCELSGLDAYDDDS